jgi:N-acylneuraminate cytidylyltransferase
LEEINGIVMHNVIAIIPARSGSKRILKKNIKNFFGRPMLSYAVGACKEADIFSEIMVSTDTGEIAEIARQYGARVPFLRSPKTSNDTAVTYDVLEEVVAMYQQTFGKEYSYVCCIYPCVPLLSGKTLKDAYDQFILSDVDAMIPVCKFPVPVEWAMKIENGLLVPNDRKAILIRSQDLIPQYFDVGMFYFIKTSALLKQKTLTPSNTIGYIMNEKEIQDIDTIDDWTMAEIKYRVLQEYNNG